MDRTTHELARPGRTPLALEALRPSMDPENYYGKADGQEHMFNIQTLASRRKDNALRLREKGTLHPTTKYEIIRGRPDQPRIEWSKVATLNDNVEQAKASLSEHKAQAGESDVSFAMRKVTEMSASHDYRNWAAQREQTREWEFPEWLKESWVKSDLADHFVHLSVNTPTQVAYWASTSDAQLDLVSVVGAGSYFANFYGDVLSQQDICRMVHLADPPGELAFSGKDPEAIAHIYENSGIGSCMARTFRAAHPTSAYGGGDLEVMTLIRNGGIFARALCWPERKIVGRMYGDSNRMRIACDLAGYTIDGESGKGWNVQGEGGFEGARMLQIPAPSGGWIMPYIDLGYRVYDDGAGFFRMSKTHGVGAHSINGVMNHIPRLKEAA